jgi:hypothetical protein
MQVKVIEEPVNRYCFGLLRKMFMSDGISDYIIKKDKIIISGKDGVQTLIFPHTRQVKRYFISLLDRDVSKASKISVREIYKELDADGVEPEIVGLIGMNVYVVCGKNINNHDIKKVSESAYKRKKEHFIKITDGKINIDECVRQAK